MKIGFTGTRHGMNELQLLIFAHTIQSLELGEFHHGDCVGADSQAHDIALKHGHKIHIHPPKSSSKRAFCEGAIKVYSEKSYIPRDHDIVDACDVLIAAPNTEKEVLRSGAWTTIRYARKKKKQGKIIFPIPKVCGTCADWKFCRSTEAWRKNLSCSGLDVKWKPSPELEEKYGKKRAKTKSGVRS